MSTRYPGGILSKTAPVPTGGESGTAPGVWTLEQAAYYIKQGQWPIPYIPKYVEDVFSTWLYSGTGSTGNQIVNGIDLSTNGGMVWIKSRSTIYDHYVSDTVRGTQSQIRTNGTGAAAYDFDIAYNTNGFTLNTSTGQVNNSGQTFASWTFREQPKFFDIVTYTGTGVARTISHSLGSVPGCIIVKKTSGVGGWMTYHRSTGATQYLFLNTTAAAATATEPWNNTAPTSSVFTVGTSNSTNQSGETYVAYIFAHNAGGFGLTGSDNIVSCSSFTTDGSGNAVVNLGYEPQWLMVKNATTASNNEWRIVDNMRGFPVDGASSAVLTANTSDAEFTSGTINILNTGFQIDGLANSATFIYIAIRRGPMRTPTLGTSVFYPSTYSGNNTDKSITGVGFATDLVINKPRANTLGAGNTGVFWDRLRGFPNGSANAAIVASSTTDEASWASLFNMFGYINNTNSNPQDGYQVLNGSTDGRYVNYSSEATGYISWLLKRAPSFFDIVCYTGTGASQTVSHNLGVVPELIIVKRRNSSVDWAVYSAAVGNTQYLRLNLTNIPATGSQVWDNTTPTSTAFYVNSASISGATGGTYVAYLFATCPGVSKVGSYTGNGTSQTINCGFTGGSRFVMIKRTDSAGNWFVWDSARGIVAGNDPYVLMNSAAAEVNTNDSVDTDSTGFVVNQDAATDINVNAATYIFLAIA